MQGNLVELAVAFVIAGSFGLVVKALAIRSWTASAGRKRAPRTIPTTSQVAFTSALSSPPWWLDQSSAAVVYFFVVKAYEAAAGDPKHSQREAVPDVRRC